MKQCSSKILTSADPQIETFRAWLEKESIRCGRTGNDKAKCDRCNDTCAGRQMNASEALARFSIAMLPGDETPRQALNRQKQPLDDERFAALEAEHAKDHARLRTMQRAVLGIAGMVTSGESPFGRIPKELLVDMESIGSDLADWAESASDQEIIDDAVAQGLDPEAEAERVRQVLLTPVEHAKALARIERLERAFSAMQRVVLIPSVMTDTEEENLSNLRAYVSQIRADLAEIDRERGER